LTLPIEDDKAVKHDADSKLNQLANMLPADASDELEVQTRVRTGSIEDEIRAAIDEEQIGMVVMGTHYHGMIRRLLIGSVTEEMLRKLPVPLLTVPGDARAKALTRILFATDLTESSQEGFRFALELARTLGAHLIVHHSIEPIPVSFGGFNPVLDDPTDRKLLMEHARGKLSELELEGASRQVVVVSELTEGAASERILAASEESGCGLIVLTIHSKGLLERALLGSTAERVVRESHVPVLSLPVNDLLQRIGDHVQPRASFPNPDHSAMP
jgi:nucleotide-binding universal stress UspA family protein